MSGTLTARTSRPETAFHQVPATPLAPTAQDALGRILAPAIHMSLRAPKDPTMRTAHKLYLCCHAYTAAACSALDARPLTPGHVARADELLARATEHLRDILAFEGGRPDTAAIGDALTTIDVRGLDAVVALAARLDVAQHTGFLAKAE